MLAWSLRTLLGAARAFERLWVFLCKNGKQLISHSLATAVQWVAFPVFDPSQPADCTENGH